MSQSLADSILSRVGLGSAGASRRGGHARDGSVAAPFAIDVTRTRVYAGAMDPADPEAFFQLVEKLTAKLERQSEKGRVNWLYLDATPSAIFAHQASALSSSLSRLGSKTSATTIIPLAPYRNLLVPGLDQTVELCELVFKWVRGGYVSSECSCVCVLSGVGKVYGGALSKACTVAALFVACYLQYLGKFSDGLDAVEYVARRFAKSRSQRGRGWHGRGYVRRRDVTTAAACEYARLFGMLLRNATLPAASQLLLSPGKRLNRAPLLLRRAIVNGEAFLGDKPVHLTLRVRNQVGDGDEVLLEEAFENECEPGDGIMSYRLHTVVVGDVSLTLEMGGCLALLGIVRHTCTLHAPVCRLRREEMDVCNGYERMQLRVTPDFAVDLYLEEITSDALAEEGVPIADLQQAQRVAEAELVALEHAFARAPLQDPRRSAKGSASHRTAASTLPIGRSFLSELRDEQARRNLGPAGEHARSLRMLLNAGAEMDELDAEEMRDVLRALHLRLDEDGLDGLGRIGPGEEPTSSSSSAEMHSANETDSCTSSSSSSYDAMRMSARRRLRRLRMREAAVFGEGRAGDAEDGALDLDEEAIAAYLLGKKGKSLSATQRHALLELARETVRRRRELLAQSAMADPNSIEAADELSVVPVVQLTPRSRGTPAVAATDEQLSMGDAAAAVTEKGAMPPPPPPPPPPMPGDAAAVPGAPPPPPPPPPPPGGGTILGASRFSRKPRRNVKQLHWSPIPESTVHETIFSKRLHTHLDSELEMSSAEIEEMFTTKRVGATKGSGATGDLSAEGVDGQVPVQERRRRGPRLWFLESKRATNLEIMLSKFPADAADIADALVRIDCEEPPLLSTENLLAMHMNQPNEEELQTAWRLVLEMERPALEVPERADVERPTLETLSRAERLVCALAGRLGRLEADVTAPTALQSRLRAKLDAALALRQFDALAHEAEQQVDSVLTACRQIFDSDRLASVLSAVLAIGNYLNQGTHRGNAHGFRIASVLKLQETRATTDRRTTLLHYLVKFVARRMPEALSFADDLPAVPQVARIDLAQLSAEVRALRRAVQVIRREQERVRSERVAQFVQRTEPSMQRLEQRESKMNRQLERTATYLGGSDPSDEAAAGPEAVFAILGQFMQMFRACHDEMQRREQALRRQAHRHATAYVEFIYQKAGVGTGRGDGEGKRSGLRHDRVGASPRA